MFRLAVVTFLLSIFAGYQAAPPATEVFLASFAVRDGKVTLGRPVNISNNPGYDNQPSFTPDGSALLFTSARGERKPDAANSAAIGSDIYRYELATRRMSRVTSTPESEYSPTVTPDGRHFSVVRVEADGTQRLWRFAFGGGDPELLLAEVKPVGYHAWADDDTLALFVLGRPATLQLAELSTGKAQVIANDIGRSLSRIPGGGISYVQQEERDGQASLVVMQLSPETRQSTRLVPVIAGPRNPDLAWTPDGMLLLAHEGTLYGWARGQTAFTPVADLEALGLTGATRMAVSPRGDTIAIVAQPSAARGM